ncbi:hypothetical protein LJC10_00650 [Selenomonadales bacterium OttesenSCG-928-I06]|nr:hypothetical protein [Selenomonadales bacterium OttesenSCG-928-I06]
MAIRKAVEGKFTLVPAGEQVLRIKEVDDSNYEEFDKLVVIYEDVDGNTLKENFMFTNNDDEPNETADWIYTKLGRLALQDQTLDEIDYEDFPDCYILAEIEHREGSKGGTFANIKKYIDSADGFEKKKSSKKETKKEAPEEPKKMSFKDRLAAKKKA